MGFAVDFNGKSKLVSKSFDSSRPTVDNVLNWVKYPVNDADTLYSTPGFNS